MQPRHGRAGALVKAARPAPNEGWDGGHRAGTLSKRPREGLEPGEHRRRDLRVLRRRDREERHDVVDLGHGAPSSARGEREPASGAKEERPRGRLQLADKLTAGEQRQVLEHVRGERVVPQGAAQKTEESVSVRQIDQDN